MIHFKSLFLLVGCFLIIGQTSVQGQSLDEKQIKALLKKGRRATRESEHWKAKTYYDKITNGGSRNPVHWYEAGQVYFESKVEREKSLDLFKKGLELSISDTIPELLYATADAYHFIGEYETAISYYSQYRKKVGTKNGDLTEEITRKIEICNNGVDLRSHEDLRYVEIKNLGKNINTKAADYSPVISENEDIILFCSRRAMSSKKSIDGEYFEDIYYSTKDADGSWSKSKVVDKTSGYINKEINGGKSHEAPISMSADGNTLYIYKENNIWKSDKNEKGEWGIPKKMNKNVNIGKTNHSIFITADNKEMYMVAVNASGTLGGRDIYMATANPDGSWGELSNLGATINTKYDEDAPFMSSDGKSFYFSSTGHNTMGGYDIFKSERDENGVWSKPMNIGAPINSVGNDVFYVENPSGSIAYFSSFRSGGEGHFDLYSATYDCNNIPATNIKGYSIFAENHQPVSGIIKITNKTSGEEMGTYTINPKTGKYNLVLPPDETYILELVVAQPRIELERPFTEEFYVPKQCETYNLFQQVSLSNIKNNNGDIMAQQAKFENAMFDIEKMAKRKFGLSDIKTNKTYEDSITGILGTLSHNDNLNAKNVEVTLLNLNNEILRITKTDVNGDYAFEKINPNEKYIVIFNEEDALRSYRAATDNNTADEAPIQGFIRSYSDDKHSAKSNTSIYIGDDNNLVKNSTSSDGNGYFELTNQPSDPSEIKSINDNTTVTYNMDIPTEEVLFSAYLINADPNDPSVTYTEYIDMVDLKDIIIKNDIATLDPNNPKLNTLDPLDPNMNPLDIKDPKIDPKNDITTLDPNNPKLNSQDPLDPNMNPLDIKDPKNDITTLDPNNPKLNSQDPLDPNMDPLDIKDPKNDITTLDPNNPKLNTQDPLDPNMDPLDIKDPKNDITTLDPNNPKLNTQDPLDPNMDPLDIKDPKNDITTLDPNNPKLNAQDPLDPNMDPLDIKDPKNDITDTKNDPVETKNDVADTKNNPTNTTTDIVDIKTNNGGPQSKGEFTNLYFDFDKYFLRDKSKNILENLYSYLNDHPNATVRLDGHTDWIGTEEYNNTLSQVRTLIAYKYLIDKGIDPNRLENAWFGESRPAISNATASGKDSPANRQLNRRVEIKLEIPEMAALYIQL